MVGGEDSGYEISARSGFERDKWCCHNSWAGSARIDYDGEVFVDLITRLSISDGTNAGVRNGNDGACA